MHSVKDNWSGRLHVNPLMSCHLNWSGRFRREWNSNATEDDLRRNWSEEDEKDLALLRSLLCCALDDQKIFLEDKSHFKWYKDGDRNTKLFHNAAKVRRSFNRIKITLEDGSVSDNRDDVGNMVLDFFQHLLGELSSLPDSSYFENIILIISPEYNAVLSASTIKDEIWAAVTNLPKDTAPGPGGFNGIFLSNLSGCYWI